VLKLKFAERQCGYSRRRGQADFAGVDDVSGRGGSLKSFWNTVRLWAMAGRGVAESLTSILKNDG